jgi:REP element-mobilizing transposase RayT
LVFTIKDREPFIYTPSDEKEIFGYLRKKAHEIDAYIEELGSWYEHVHILLRCGTTIPLAQLYRQLKGFTSRAWNIKHPDRRLRWSDGVYIATVDPHDNQGLRTYIRDQRQNHSQRQLIGRWECADDY